MNLPLLYVTNITRLCMGPLQIDLSYQVEKLLDQLDVKFDEMSSQILDRSEWKGSSSLVTRFIYSSYTSEPDVYPRRFA
jgi:Heat shock factor binding protein 1